MERWVGKVAVVTGASSVVGAAIVKALAEKGLKVVPISKRRSRIDELARTLENTPGRVYPVRCDVAREEDVIQSFKWINESIGTINILINSASLTKYCSLTEGCVEDWHRIFDINVIALCICTKEAIKSMKANSVPGHIVQMQVTYDQQNSVDHKQMNVLHASKMAIAGLTETFRRELQMQNSRIKVSSVSALGVSTETKTVTEDEAMETNVSLSPEEVAEAVVYILSTAPHIQVQDLKICSSKSILQDKITP